MIAFRQTVQPVNRRVIIDLPSDFDSESVEVIVLPLSDNGKKQSQKLTRKNLFGKYQGKMWISPDFDAPLDDFKEYME